MNYCLADAALVELTREYSQEPWWGSASVQFDRNLGHYFIQVWIVPDAKHSLPADVKGVKINVVNKAMPVRRY